MIALIAAALPQGAVGMASASRPLYGGFLPLSGLIDRLHAA
jgi:hypothetical protein